MRWRDLIIHYKASDFNNFDPAVARESGIKLWDFRTIINDIAEACKDQTYFIDDTLRTVQLFRWVRSTKPNS